MTVSEWLDKKVAEGVDVSHIALPEDLAQDEAPDETLYFKEIRPCSVLCTGDHPFATVERYGRWYLARGREKEKGPHTTKAQWWLFTRNQDQAIETARTRIEK